jgi:hypothetical protein
MIEKVHDQEAPVTADQVAKAGRQLGCKFPDEYVAFLLKYNGGQPEPSEFPISKTGNSRVNCLLSVLDESAEEKEFFDIVRTNLRKRKKGELPDDVIQVGYDSFGNGICLGVAGKRRGQVFFLDHEELEGQPLSERFWKIADNFTQFLDSLHESSDD